MSHVAALMERLARASDAMDVRHRNVAEQHQRTVEALPHVLREAADHVLGDMVEDATRSLREGLNEPFAKVALQAAEHCRLTKASADSMIEVQRRLAVVARKASWAAAGLLAILLSVVALGGYLGWHYTQVIAQQKVEADLLRMYNRADLRLCGKELCARVDRSDKRYGDYFPVKRR